MRIPCPFCGSRDSREFVTRGDAAPVRPQGAEAQTDSDALYAYVYERANPAGALEEWWYHAQGCRQWLKVTRDTHSHAVSAAALARTGGAA